MKVAIYLRVSRIDLHPENQLLELERFAKAMGWDYEIFEEKESTRKTRPIKNKIFQEALQKKWDCIFVYKLDRWARSFQELINDINRLKQYKVEFRSLGDNIIVNDDPRNMLMIHILGAFAEFERAMIRERTMVGLERARAQGKKLGRPTKDGKKYSRPSRNQVSELMAKGLTVREIAKELKTSKYWAHTVIKEVREMSLSETKQESVGVLPNKTDLSDSVRLGQ
jgi:putative DNA-invertase from lambdoid prophage Rac